MTYLAARAGYEQVCVRLMRLALPGSPNYALVGDPRSSCRRGARQFLDACGSADAAFQPL